MPRGTTNTPTPAQEEARQLILAVLSKNDPPWTDDFADERVNLFLRCLWNGLTINDSIQLSTWNQSGYFEYLVKSGSSRTKQPMDPPMAEFARFASRVDQALLSTKARLVRTVMDAAIGGDVKAAQWALERRWPEEWGVKGPIPFRIEELGSGLHVVQLILPSNGREDQDTSPPVYEATVTEENLSTS